MRKLLAAISLAAVLALGAITAQADHSWNGYHWKSTSLSPTVQDNTSSALYDVPVGVTEWATLGASIQPVLTDGKGKVKVTEEFNPFWYGLARIFIDDAGHITKAEVKLNTVLLEPLGLAAADHVLCQELGHILGLDHNRVDANTCMNDTAAIGSATTPNAHDADQLRAIYNHTDPTGGGRRGNQRAGWVTVDVVPVP